MTEEMFNCWQGQEILLYSKVLTLALGPIHHPTEWVMTPLSLVLQQPGHRAEQSRPLNTTVKNEWSYTSAPLFAFIVCIGTALPCTV